VTVRRAWVGVGVHREIPSSLVRSSSMDGCENEAFTISVSRHHTPSLPPVPLHPIQATFQNAAKNLLLTTPPSHSLTTRPQRNTDIPTPPTPPPALIAHLVNLDPIDSGWLPKGPISPCSAHKRHSPPRLVRACVKRPCTPTPQVAVSQREVCAAVHTFLFGRYCVYVYRGRFGDDV
jgi:hypothetical protein